MKFFKGKHAPRLDKEAHRLGKKWDEERDGKPEKKPKPKPKHKK